METRATFAEETRRARVGGPARGTVRLPSEAEQGLEERLALLTCTFGKGREAALLEGLTGAKRDRALKLAEETAQLSSPARAARIAQAFQERPAAADRARRLVGEASAALSQAILAELPPYLRPEGCALQRGLQPGAPLKAFAARLAQEATR